MERASFPGKEAGALLLVQVGADSQLFATDRGVFASADPAKLFMTASVSKLIIALAAAKLALHGRIDLDAPVWSYAPEVVAALPPSHRMVSARQLISHAAGLGPPYERPATIGQERPPGPITIVGAPGTYVYSAGSYRLLASALTARRADFWPWLSREMTSWGMRDSSLTMPRDGTLHTGHLADGTRVQPYGYPDPAAAGLVTTIEDLASLGREIIRFWQAGDTGEATIPKHVWLSSGYRALVDGRRRDLLLGLPVARSPGSGILLLNKRGADVGWRALLAVAPERRGVLAFISNSDASEELLARSYTLWSKFLDGSGSRSASATG